LLIHKICLKRQELHGTHGSFSLVFAKVNGRKPDERSKCSIVGLAYGRHSTYQNVVSDQICPRVSRRSATSKVRFSAGSWETKVRTVDRATTVQLAGGK